MISNHIISDFEVAIGHIMNGIEVCKLNENFTITYVNDSFLHLTGYSPDEILDCGSHKLFMHDNDFENFKSEIHHNLKTHNDFEIEYKIIKKDSRSIWVLDKCSIKKASDENIYLYHVITDISNQKEKEQLLLQRISELEREKQYGTTMASNQLLTYEANVTQNSIISVNPDWAREFGITSSTHFSDLVISIAENAVAPEHRVIFLQTLSRESIISAFEENRHILSIEYLKHINNNQFRWFRKNINIIQDNITKDISIRCYIADIDYKKSREIKAFEEQRLYETMRSRADVIYEINITKNNFIAGHNSWGKLFGISQTSNYSDMMQQFSENAIHPDDKEGFKEAFKRSNVLEAYEDGKMDII
ncbi:MAG: PAS domain-containing protein, partial [Oscillospiraceae bacterium]